MINKKWEIKKLCDPDVPYKIGDGLHGTPKYVDSSDVYFINGNNLSDNKILITNETKCIGNDEFDLLKKT